MDDRRSHFYDLIPMEFLKDIIEIIRKAPTDEDAMVVYFASKGGESSEKVRERL